MFTRLSIKRKLIYWNMLILIIFSCFLVYFSNSSINKMMEDKREQIKNLIEVGHSIIVKYVNLEKQGVMTRQQAQDAAYLSLSEAIYDDDNYYFVTEYDLKQVVNPKRPKDRGKFQTLDIYKQFLELVQKNPKGDYLIYKTSKLGKQGDFPKLSYIKPIPEWKWFIGTGIYIDDIDEQKRVYIYLLLSIFVILTTLLVSGGITFANMIANPLNRVSNLLLSSADLMKEKSGSLKKMSQNVVNSSNDQANSIRNTAAAVAEVTSMIAKTSSLTDQSSQLAKNVVIGTEAGKLTVNNMVQSMTSIKDASNRLKEIESIIKQIEIKALVINEIVNKTELLSLNASIEAARAGEYGKGFAVVAEEVGNLANTSGKAANEIRELLEKSRSSVDEILNLTIQRVDEGQANTEEVAQVFEKIIMDVGEISSQITEITEATREQEIGVKQFASSMSEINTLASNNAQNAANSTEESAAVLIISDELRVHVDSMQKIIAGRK